MLQLLRGICRISKIGCLFVLRVKDISKSITFVNFHYYNISAMPPKKNQVTKKAKANKVTNVKEKKTEELAVENEQVHAALLDDEEKVIEAKKGRPKRKVVQDVDKDEPSQKRHRTRGELKEVEKNESTNKMGTVKTGTTKKASSESKPLKTSQKKVEAESETEDDEDIEEDKTTNDDKQIKKKKAAEKLKNASSKSKPLKTSRKKVEKEPEREDDEDIEEDKTTNDDKQIKKKKAAEKPKNASSKSKPLKNSRKKIEKEPEREDDEDIEEDKTTNDDKQTRKKKAADKPKSASVETGNTTKTIWNELKFECVRKNQDGEKENYKITSWNVDGIRAWIKKDGLNILRYASPDILCLQEIKCESDKIPAEMSDFEGYEKFWCSSKKKGYAGVGLLTKIKPLNVLYGIGNEDHDEDGRCITAEFDEFFLVTVYVPNAGRKLVTLDKRLEWNGIFKDFINGLDKKKPVIICGDMNVAHNEIDLTNPKTNTKNAGFTEEEREGMTDFLNEGFIDTFRALYPDKRDSFTFWSYLNSARKKNIGWRLDYFIVSKRFQKKICDNIIHDNVFGSDHCPLTLYFNV